MNADLKYYRTKISKISLALLVLNGAHVRHTRIQVQNNCEKNYQLRHGFQTSLCAYQLMANQYENEKEMQ